MPSVKGIVLGIPKGGLERRYRELSGLQVHISRKYREWIITRLKGFDGCGDGDGGDGSTTIKYSSMLPPARSGFRF